MRCLTTANDSLPIVGDECARRAMALACATLVENLGFSHCTVTSLDTLAALSIRHLEKFCLQLHNITEHGGRSRPTISDAETTFHRMLGVEREITDYVRQTVQTSKTRTAPMLPLLGSSSSLPASASEKIDESDEMKERGDEIPDWTPQIYRKEITREILEERRRALEERKRMLELALKNTKPEPVIENFPNFLDGTLFSLGLYREPRKEIVPLYKSKTQPLSIIVNEPPQYTSELLHHTLPQGPSTASPRAPVLRLKILKSDSQDGLISPIIPSSAPPTFKGYFTGVDGAGLAGKEIPANISNRTSSSLPGIAQGQKPPFIIPALPKKPRGRPMKKVSLPPKRKDAKKVVDPTVSAPMTGNDLTVHSNTSDNVNKAPLKSSMVRKYSAPIPSPMVLPDRTTRAIKPRALSPPPPAAMITSNRRKSQPAQPATSIMPIPRPAVRAASSVTPKETTATLPSVSPAAPLSTGPLGHPRRQHQPPRKYMDFESDLLPSLGGRKRMSSNDVNSSPKITAPPAKRSREEKVPKDKGRISLPPKPTISSEKKKTANTAAALRQDNRRVSMPAISIQDKIVPPLRLVIPRHTIDDIHEESDVEDDLKLDQGELVEDNGSSTDEGTPLRAPLKLRISFGGNARTVIDDPFINSPEPRVAIEIDIGTKNEDEHGGQVVVNGEQDGDTSNRISPSVEETLDELIDQVGQH